jgi:hypothetical protein
MVTAEQYGDICDVVERTYQDLPLDGDEPVGLTSAEARAAALRIIEILGLEFVPTSDDCPDCGVAPGRRHHAGCDVARCLETGHQRLSCAGGHDCGQDVWTGEWPREISR